MARPISVLFVGGPWDGQTKAVSADPTPSPRLEVAEAIGGPLFPNAVSFRARLYRLELLLRPNPAGYCIEYQYHIQE